MENKTVKDVIELILAIVVTSFIVMVIWNITIVKISDAPNLNYIDALFLNIIVKALVYKHYISVDNIIKKFVDKL